MNVAAFLFVFSHGSSRSMIFPIYPHDIWIILNRAKVIVIFHEYAIDIPYPRYSPKKYPMRFHSPWCCLHHQPGSFKAFLWITRHPAVVSPTSPSLPRSTLKVSRSLPWRNIVKSPGVPALIASMAMHKTYSWWFLREYALNIIELEMVLHSFYGIIQYINAVKNVLTTGVLGHKILYPVIFMGT